MKKVVKFGGSSLASAEQFKKVGKIIHADDSRVYVVPSAPGKRFDGDTKVTDMLLHAYQTASEGNDVDEELKAIKARYDEIITGLELKDFSLLLSCQSQAVYIAIRSVPNRSCMILSYFRLIA